MQLNHYKPPDIFIPPPGIQRASAVNLPLLVVFAEVEEELHHTYHNGAEEEGEEQQQKGDSRADGGGGDGFAGAGRSRPMGVWTFDSLRDVLRPVGLEWRHDVNVLVGDKRAHSYEMHNYGLACETHTHTKNNNTHTHTHTTLKKNGFRKKIKDM
jgi:hypothetical protein